MVSNRFRIVTVIFVLVRLIFTKDGAANHGLVLTPGSYRSAYQLYGLPSLPSDLNSSFPGIIVDESLFYSCDVDARRKLIYLFDVRHSSIVVGNNFNIPMERDTMNFTTEHHVVITNDVRVAVDWLSHNVYWTDQVLGAIMMRPGNQYVDRTIYTVIVQEHVDRPQGITLDPNSGYLFWTDTSKDSFKIERCSLTGQNRTLVIADLQHLLTAITADVNEKRIYFAKADYIESVNYDGTGRKHLFWIGNPDNAWRIFDIAVFNDMILATENQVYTRNAGRIYQISKTGKLIYHNTDPIDVLGICVYDSNQQNITKLDLCADAGCQDICVNEADKAKCLCRMGFELQPNGKNCTESSGQYHRAIVVNNGTHLCLLNLLIRTYEQDFSVECFYQHESDETISHIDVDMESREVFFATKSAVYTVPVDMNDANAVQIATAFTENDAKGSITGLSYDWVNENLYWSQSNPDGIFIVKPHRNEAEDFVLPITHGSPREVLVVPHAQKLFWIADSENEPFIETAELSGSKESTHRLDTRQKFLKLLRIYHDVKYEQLAILYRTENSYDISYVDYSGETLQNLAISPTMGDCALYQDVLLFMAVDSSNYTVLFFRDRRGSPFSSPTTLGTVEEIGTVISMTVIDLAVLQPAYRNPCGEHGFKLSGCNQICFSYGDEAKCSCEIGFSLMGDEKTCKTSTLEDNFILIAEDHYGKVFQLALNSPAEIQAIEIFSSRRLQGILFNDITNMIIWVQYGSSQVFMSSLDGKTEKLLADIAIFRGRPTKFALESTTGNIYFVGHVEAPSPKSLTYIIGVISPKGDANIIYSDDVYQWNGPAARDIVLHQGKGLMFWTVDLSGIMRAGMDGSSAKAIESGERLFRGIALDYSTDFLYWYELNTPTIYRSDLDGNDVTEFYTDTGKSFLDIRLLGEYIYYSGQSRIQVTRLNKHNASDITRLGPNFGIGVITRFEVYSSNDSLLTPKNKACSFKNGGCSHFCLPNSRGGRTCACKYGVSLETDNKTCNGTTCPKDIPNGKFDGDCIPKVGFSCNNFTCNQGYARNKAVSSLICNESGLWNYDLTMLCKETQKNSDTRILIIVIGVGFGLLLLITSIVILIGVLYRQGKILTNFRAPKIIDASSEISGNLDDSGIADTSLNYIEHLSWLRTRINQFILDEDADKAFINPGERHH